MEGVQLSFWECEWKQNEDQPLDPPILIPSYYQCTLVIVVLLLKFFLIKLDQVSKQTTIPTQLIKF